MRLDRWFLSLLLMLIGAKLIVGDYVHNVSVHVLDWHVGKPASGVKLTLLKLDEYYHEAFITSGITNDIGKLSEFTSACMDFTRGLYKLRFSTKEYYTNLNKTTFYPFIDIVFEVDDPNLHHHIPLLLNTFSYTTYRGSVQQNLQENIELGN